MKQVSRKISIVVPTYNEAAGIETFHADLSKVLAETEFEIEILYCDDGSIDQTNTILQKIASKDSRVRVITLSRNFGKEVALTAGIHCASGDAILTLDADGQHPVELIPDFIARWQSGAKVVIGMRSSYNREGFVKKIGSSLFYGLFSRLVGIRLSPGATDFRLIDRTVQQDFARMTERNRITRGLIEWLGYEREYLYFTAKARESGTAGYGIRKLFKLAIDSAISLSISPLYLTAYIGAVVLPISTLLGLGMAANYLLGDPLNFHATGGAYLMVLILFLIGILMVSQGIIGLYLSHIHTETQNRPLYVIDETRSKGFKWND